MIDEVKRMENDCGDCAGDERSESDLKRVAADVCMVVEVLKNRKEKSDFANGKCIVEDQSGFDTVGEENRRVVLMELRYSSVLLRVHLIFGEV